MSAANPVISEAMNPFRAARTVPAEIHGRTRSDPVKSSNSTDTDGPVAGSGPIVESERPLAVSTPRRPAIDSLTSLRGIAAVWVVLYHFQSDLIAFLPAAAFLKGVPGRGPFRGPDLLRAHRLCPHL